MKELSISSGYEQPGETLECLIDKRDNSKFLTVFENSGMVTLVFEFHRPITVTGYSFESANDCPGRDPRKWDINFRIPDEHKKYCSKIFSKDELNDEGDLQLWSIEGGAFTERHQWKDF